MRLITLGRDSFHALALGSAVLLAGTGGIAGAETPDAAWKTPWVLVSGAAPSRVINAVNTGLRQAGETYFYGERPTRMDAIVSGNSVTVTLIDPVTGAVLARRVLEIDPGNPGSSAADQALTWLAALHCGPGCSNAMGGDATAVAAQSRPAATPAPSVEQVARAPQTPHVEPRRETPVAEPVRTVPRAEPDLDEPRPAAAAAPRGSLAASRPARTEQPEPAVVTPATAQAAATPEPVETMNRVANTTVNTAVNTTGNTAVAMTPTGHVAPGIFVPIARPSGDDPAVRPATAQGAAQQVAAASQSVSQPVSQPVSEARTAIARQRAVEPQPLARSNETQATTSFTSRALRPGQDARPVPSPSVLPAPAVSLTPAVQAPAAAPQAAPANPAPAVQPAAQPAPAAEPQATEPQATETPATEPQATDQQIAAAPPADEGPTLANARWVGFTPAVFTGSDDRPGAWIAGPFDRQQRVGWITDTATGATARVQFIWSEPGDDNAKPTLSQQAAKALGLALGDVANVAVYLPR